MFFPDRSCKVYIATGVTDMRKSINGLALLVAGQLGLSPLTGSLFCFCNRQRTLIKILYWDRNGFGLWQKRLEKERFRWPNQVEDVVLLQGRELSWLLDGLPLEQRLAHGRFSYQSVA